MWSRHWSLHKWLMSAFITVPLVLTATCSRYIYGEVHVRLQRRVSEGFGVTRTYSVDLTQTYKSTVMLDLP